MNEEKSITRRRAIECPHCHEGFFVEVNFEVAGMLAAESQDDWRVLLRPEQLDFLERANDNGLLTAFQQTVEVAKKNQMPRVVEKFMLTWFETAEPKMIPSYALEFYRREFPNTDIKVLGGNGILCILANRQIKCFVPSEIVTGKNLRTANGSSLQVKIPVSETELLVWKRTRLGYVLKGSIFADELKSVAIGSFAKPRIEIRNRC